MEQKVLNILKEVFDVDELDNTCSQENTKEWDSMAQLNIVAELEDAFDISIEPIEISQMKTFVDIIQLLNKKCN